MKWIEECKVARAWFQYGKEQKAVYVMYIYNLDKEMQSILLYSDEDLKSRVLNILNDPSGATFIGVISTEKPIDCVDDIFRPTNVIISRVEN